MKTYSNKKPWTEFEPHEWVTVSKEGRILFEGSIDDKTEDVTVLWLVPTNGPRRLLHLWDGVQVKRSRA